MLALLLTPTQFKDTLTYLSDVWGGEREPRYVTGCHMRRIAQATGLRK